ncbi:MAG: nitrate reductase cytochrome c-type subunit [Gammaproteobacteria bacterium]|nr:nitrate reductase cytochrome c-type subunit [Gammaproteobacteria bacterium]NNJ92557.1 nitrate reductase cytochrome c-type subunit [Gammaproteobacteria bacterium]
MKKTLLNLLALFMLVAVSSALFAEVQSLRGSVIEADSNVPEVKPYFKDRPPMARDYLQQPPLIPHKVDGYIVNIKHNKCLSCHSWKNYKQHNATKISQTHFESRDGAVMSNVSARRYFCQQCHVPQADARPLVENTFSPVDAMRIQ